MHQASAHAPSTLARSVATGSGLSHFDPINIGVDAKTGEEKIWSYPTVSNFNIIFLGGSGAGKTHTIHHMAANVFVRGTTLHVIDIKGDFSHSNFEETGLGAMLSPEDFNDIKFNYYTDGCSLNPLQVPRTEEGGGVVRTIEYVKELVKIFNPQAGQKQLNYLVDILKLYCPALVATLLLCGCAPSGKDLQDQSQLSGANNAVLMANYQDAEKLLGQYVYRDRTGRPPSPQLRNDAWICWHSRLKSTEPWS